LGGRILVVDDDPLNRRMLARSLDREGHEAVVVAGGEECLAELDTSSFDIVLLDIMMPDLDGFEVLTRIKASPDLRHMPVIMISGLEDTDSVVRCIELGADDFLPKPFDPIILRARVNAGLDRVALHRLEDERVRGAFARFLPETVVDEAMARTGGGLRLGAERLVGTVMFTDLRGFTTFAERAEAGSVIDVLNRYLSQMGDAVLDHGGTLVGYLGDGILAAFGAPIPMDDHADRAIDAAREMADERLPEFNRWLTSEGICDGFRMGIGLNTGPLMSGNVGSERRLEYTVIGDTVNTASRIEGLTKDATFSVLVAEETRASLRAERDDLAYVDEFEIRGRTSRIKLWGIAPD
jgi:adenylate cyclase